MIKAGYRRFFWKGPTDKGLTNDILYACVWFGVREFFNWDEEQEDGISGNIGYSILVRIFFGILFFSHGRELVVLSGGRGAI